MWTNLGYWPGAVDYPSAARELARRVGKAARLRPGDVVLDFACGFGDSLRLWIEEFGVARVIGVEPDPDVQARTQRRLDEWGLQERVLLLTQPAEAVEVATLTPRPTAVVCVDAAYHFTSRRAWLSQLLAALPPGARLGLSDLSITPRGQRSRLLRALSGLFHIPSANLTDAGALDALLESDAVRLRWQESAGDAVLDGFVRVQRRGGLPVFVTRQLLRLARQRRLIEYRILGAERRTP